MKNIEINTDTELRVNIINDSTADTENYTALKYCKSCDQLHTLNQFSRDKRNKDGYQQYCKSCRRSQYNNWIDNNKDRLIQYTYNRKVLENTQKIKKISEQQWEYILSRFNYSCAYCNMTMREHYEKYNQRLHKEHIISIASCGDCSTNNIVPACKSCNSSKENENWVTWYAQSDKFNLINFNTILDYINENHTTKLEKFKDNLKNLKNKKKATA